MKTKMLSFVAMFMFGALTLFAENATESFEVKGGDCAECKTHIEQAALGVDGVLQATWNVKTKQIEVVFDDTKTSVDAIETAIAKGGNDTANHKAKDEDADKLPDCCKYERENEQ